MILVLLSHVFVFPLNVAGSLSSSHLQAPAEQAFLINACHARRLLFTQERMTD